MSNYSIYNQRSELDFNAYNTNSFSTGIEGAEIGVILDLGTGEELKRRYGYEETVGGGEGFTSIHRKDRTVYIIRDRPYQGKFQPMTESAQLFRGGATNAHVPIQHGHFYLLRLTDQLEPKFERIVKMIVLAFQPDQWVTIRWAILE